MCIRDSDRAYPWVDTGNGRFTVGICMDLNDDGFTGWIQQQNPDVVAFPTNWVDTGESVWPYWAFRMQGSRAALVAANRYGSESLAGAEAIGPTDEERGITRFSGASCVLQWRSHEGELRPTVLASLPTVGDGGVAVPV